MPSAANKNSREPLIRCFSFSILFQQTGKVAFFISGHFLHQTCQAFSLLSEVIHLHIGGNFAVLQNDGPIDEIFDLIDLMGGDENGLFPGQAACQGLRAVLVLISPQPQIVGTPRTSWTLIPISFAPLRGGGWILKGPVLESMYTHTHTHTHGCKAIFWYWLLMKLEV